MSADRTDLGPGPDPKEGRFDAEANGLRVALVLVGIAALASVVLPGRASDVAAVVAVAGLLAAPVGRTVWLAQRWFRRGDVRYGLVALGVLAVMGLGALLAR